MSMPIDQGIVLASVSATVLQRLDERLAAKDIHLHECFLHDRDDRAISSIENRWLPERRPVGQLSAFLRRYSEHYALRLLVLAAIRKE